MPDRWFNLPKTTLSDGTIVPDYVDRAGVDGWSGNVIGNSPRYVVRVYGTTSALDAIANESGATELEDATAAANKLTDRNTAVPDGFDGTNAENGFRIE